VDGKNVRLKLMAKNRNLTTADYNNIRKEIETASLRYMVK